MRRMKSQRKRTIEGDLVIGWLNFFDVKARFARRKQKKVFFIGLPKTGTTSAHYALSKAGYKAEHFPYFLVNFDGSELVFNGRDLKRHDAVSDLPVAASLENLVELYPDAAFVLTTRNKEKWLDSCRRHPWPIEITQYWHLWDKVRRAKHIHPLVSSANNNLQKLEALHNRVLGSSVFVPELFSEYYDRYHEKVRTLLGGKTNYLELNIADKGDTKEKLGAFLGLEMSGPFERKDCFYTWLFKNAVKFFGWDRIEQIREEYRRDYLKAA